MEQVQALLLTVCLFTLSCASKPKEEPPPEPIKLEAMVDGNATPIPEEGKSFSSDMIAEMKCHKRKAPNMKSKSLGILPKGKEVWVMDSKAPRWLMHYDGKLGEVYLGKACFGM